MQAGNIRLALMLDPHQAALLPTAVPGLVHLPLRGQAQRPFKLMHAKVALLGFRHESDANRWCVRLVVSTGNWTRQTVEDSLDLACELQVFSEELGKSREQECADIGAATRFLYALRNLYDTRLLSAEPPLSGGDAAAALEKWLRTCGMARNNPKKLSPRFIDNLKRPLLGEVIRQLQSQGPCDYMAMGSGFYEGQPSGNGVQLSRPDVPVKVVADLKEAKLLKQSSRVELYVNPLACQSIAASVDYLKDRKISVHAATPPPKLYGVNSRRTLHAKFIFCANRSKKTGACNNSWLYLGSGNLTRAGMTERMSHKKGNLEAGMILRPKNLYWKDRRISRVMVQDQLPIGGPEIEQDTQALAAGGGWETPFAENIAAPIAYLHWRVEGVLATSYESEHLQPSLDGVQVLDESGVPCCRVSGGYAWPGVAPRTVRLRWSTQGKSHEAWVPVIDEFGRVAATLLEKLELVDAEQSLIAFPGMPDTEIEGPEDAKDLENKSVPSNKRRSRKHRTVSQGMAIRQMMSMLERIASLQVEISQEDWPRWCSRLEQTLTQAHESAAVTQFVAMGLNPISPLRATPFRPRYAEDPASEASRRYDAALKRVEQAWKTADLMALGNQT